MWPGITTPAVMSRVGGSCFVFGGALAALVATLSPASFRSPAVQLVNAAAAVTIGCGILLWGHRQRLSHFHVLTLLATIQITVTVWQAAAAPVEVSFATLYVFIACIAFFVPWPAAAAQLAIAMCCCMVVLTASSTAPWWSGLVAAGATAGMGAVIAGLGRIVFDAEWDPLTGLPGSRAFERLLAVHLAGAHPANGPTIVRLAASGYRAIADELGHHTADHSLRTTLAAWRDVLDVEHALGRLGPDEICLLLPESGEQEAVALTHRLRAHTAMACCAGVTAWRAGESASSVLARAGVALRRAQRTGRNETVLEPSAVSSTAEELREALTTDDLEVAYQPVVGLNAGQTIGVEALLRWTPTARPDMTASDVIRVAEQNGLIAEVDAAMLRRGCEDAHWMQERLAVEPLSLHVNVSGLELIEAGYVERVIDILRAASWPADQLVLEVTESVLDVDEPASIAALTALRNHGVRVAIDDFGTGYSSLGRLHTVPTDYLKLDASFAASLPAEAATAPPVLQATAALADALGLPVIAEGVETAHQAAALRRLDVRMAQGFHFGRPQPREEIVATAGAGQGLPRGRAT